MFPVCVCVCTLFNMITIILPILIGKRHSLWQKDMLHWNSLDLWLKVDRP